ncbi:hypothetical protein BH18ACI3_BH18ACI3_02470 [soil metagenome]
MGQFLFGIQVKWDELDIAHAGTCDETVGSIWSLSFAVLAW